MVTSSEKIGFVGLGKLGLPCAAAMSVKTGTKVFGFDPNPDIQKFVEAKQVPYIESQIEEYLKSADIEVVDSVDTVVKESSLIFVAVQTPHHEMYEGITPLPDTRKDFDYSFLVSAIDRLATAIRSQKKHGINIVVISTVLPGTMRRLVLPKLPLAEFNLSFCYNPFFIAMGTTIPDFLDPEFILIGSDDFGARKRLANFYSSFLNAPTQEMQIESAELAKVAYNTFIGFKIVFANTIGEICDARGGSSDEVTQALSHATTRLMSGKYLSAGMGDGGGCHPRDQIAMSWLAQDANLSVDVFEWLARARDLQTERQARLILKYQSESGLPIVLLGKSYKANINLTVGSPALLLSFILKSMGAEFSISDPHVDGSNSPQNEPAVFFISSKHDAYKQMKFPPNSIVIDPWGDAVVQSKDILLIRPGR